MHMIEIYPDVVHMIEVVLIGLVVALVGAGGYVFLVSSMWADRKRAVAENRAPKSVGLPSGARRK
jgi:uncharacterized membrane protein YqhA